ncbi:MAG: hypothetical protein LBQ66_06710 [Planctomycetaceae bacterium]|jgi:flagellin-like hook-associated protein FlgL|nr:hypothetical protein [Planctomycetaceae bacterium]
MSIIPLGFNRVSVPLQVHRAGNSLAGAASLMSKYEQQLTTELQYRFGSDSPYNASTTLSIQSLMERKAQNVSNLKTTQSFLSATDETLSKVSSLTNDAQAMALNALNTLTTAQERSSLAQSVNQIVQQFFSFGNNSFGGRYLFSGSVTDVMPFEWGADSYYTVNYRGNESNIFSWSDTDILSKSNMNGVEIFGAISDPVHGKVDLNPSVSGNTLLADLNGGRGVDKGFVQVTYTLNGNKNTYEIDLSKCSSLADVKRQLEGNWNPYFNLKVDIDDNGLVISLPTDLAGTVKISESGRGTVAKQLGIPTDVSFDRNSNLVCRDLNPALTSTTSLQNILGARSNVTLAFAGSNNDILIESKHNGESYTDSDGNVFPLNGVNIAILADSNVTKGNESATFDSSTQTVVIKIHPDNTTANDIIAAINQASEAGEIPPINAKLSQTDQIGTDQAGTGIVSFLPGFLVTCGTLSGGEGVDFDFTGIELTNGNMTHNISFSDCETVGELLAKLNDPSYGLYAEINESKTGIDIRSRVSGADFCIGENGGQSASQLGIRTVDFDTQLSEFDYGRGVSDYNGPGETASAKYSGTAANSSLILRAKSDGKIWNDYKINFVQTNDVNGKVVVSMDEDSKTINIAINSGVTTAKEIVEAFDTQTGAKEFFDLELDTSQTTNNGEGVVYLGQTKTEGGTNGGIDFSITRNDGTVLEIDVRGAKTAGDILRIINEHENNTDGLLVARLAEFGNGIELVDSSFGDSVLRVDRALLSTSAIELGLINYGEEYRTITNAGGVANETINENTLNGALLITAKHAGSYADGVNIEMVEGLPTGVVWDAASGTLRFQIESGVTTANDIIKMFEEQTSEQVRSMFSIQNGINADGSSSNGNGLVTTETTTMQGGQDVVLGGNDPNPKETESLFGALIRMEIGMERNDTREIERASQMLTNAIDRLHSARTTVGIMQNSLDNVQDQLSNENVRFEQTLDVTYRIDYADASISYLAQQLSYQASMQVTASMFQMSLLNYL